MLKLLTKTWMIASLIVATSAFGQDSCNPCPKPCAPKCERPCPKPCPAPCPKPCGTPCPAPACKPKCCPTPCPQPCPPTQLCPPPCPNPCCPPWPVPVLNAAYNYPAGIKTRCPWDIYFDAAFIYWQPIQENMELGMVNETAAVGGSFATAAGIDGEFIGMDFDYKPGFEISFGWKSDYDGWDMHLEYTWFHNRQHHSSGVPVVGQIFPTWGSPAFLGGNVFNNVSERWRLNMDIIDADIGRWMYVGTKLTVRPYGGARAAWIRQRANVVYTNSGVLGVGTADVETISARSTSWAIGPRGGLDANWNLGAGFRIFGNSSADILFTRYNRLSFSETHTAAVAAVGVPFSTSQRRYNCLRTHIDMDLGIGWGTYWDCNNWYTDVALGYEFQVFYDQNMFRHFNSATMFGNSFTPNGNLYVHGLTAKFRLDF